MCSRGSSSATKHVKIGAVLLDMLLKCAVVDVPTAQPGEPPASEPAFVKVYQSVKHWKPSTAAAAGFGGGRHQSGYERPAYIKLHTGVIDFVVNSKEFHEILHPRYLPMIVPPVRTSRQRRQSKPFMTWIMRGSP